jgi:hypothetical protein
MVRPKRGAKALVALVPDLQLAKAQEAVAYVCGYDSWLTLKDVCEDSGVVPSVDDANLTAAQRAERQGVLIKRARDFFGVTRAQAQRILDAASLTKPAKGRPSTEPDNPIIGTNVYRPPMGFIFGPNYPFLFVLLRDVRVLELDLCQPTDDDLGLTQLASEMRVTFKSGSSLAIEGVYLWQFLDLLPPAFKDAEGELITDNPYTRDESAGALLKRLRVAYKLLWKRASDDEFKQIMEPPLRIHLDLEYGSLVTTEAPGLRATTRAALTGYLASRVEALVLAVQPTLDMLMRGYLREGYMELGYRKVNNDSVSPDYKPASWEGKEGLPFDEFLSMFSASQFSEGGCGGNLRFREKLARDLTPNVSPDLYLSSGMAQLKKEQPELFSAICEELGFSARASGKTVAEGLLSTQEAMKLTQTGLHAVFMAQKGKALSSWGELSSRKPRPLVRDPRYGAPKSERKQNA